MPDLPKVSIITLNYNGRTFLNTEIGNLLERSIASTLRLDYPNFELILVDDGSTDDSAEFLTKTFGKDPRLKIIAYSKNLGPVAAANIGMKSASGRYIAFLSSDAEGDPKWIAQLVQVMEGDPKIGVAGPKILLKDRPVIIHLAGVYLGPFGLLVNRGFFEQDRGQFQEVDEVFAVLGTAIMIRAELLEKIGSFDPTFYAYFDEPDFCWRAWLSGYKTVFVPQSIVYHGTRFRSIISEIDFQKDGYKSALSRLPEPVMQKMREVTWYHGQKNQLRSMIKNMETHSILRDMLPLVFLQLCTAAYFAVKQSHRQSIWIIQGMIWNIVNLRGALIERKKIAQKRVVSDHELRSRIFRKASLLQFFRWMNYWA